MPPLFEPRCGHGIPIDQYCSECNGCLYCGDEDCRGECQYDDSQDDDYDPDWNEDEEDWYDDPSDSNEGMR